MGAWALLLPLLVATAQAQGTCGAGAGGAAAGRRWEGADPLSHFAVCSVTNTYFEVQENTNRSEPLADIYVPDGQQVTLGASSTPSAFRIQGTQLFLNVTPDYEVQMVGVGGAPPWGQLGGPPSTGPMRAPTLLPRDGFPEAFGSQSSQGS